MKRRSRNQRSGTEGYSLRASDRAACKSQKNQLRATDDVSLPANMKFTQISRKNLSENGLPSSSFIPTNTVKRSDLCFVSSKESSFFLARMTPSAKSSTPFIDSFSFPSLPKSRNLMAFHIRVGVTNLIIVASVAASNARAKGMSGRPGLRHPGSTPKAIMHTLSNVNLRRMSCKSIVHDFSTESSKTDFIVCVEDAITQEITDCAPKIVSLREIGEPCLEKVLEVSWIRSHDAVEICEPRPFKGKSTILAMQDFRNPLVHVSLNSDD
ncbi:hypothetical protein ACJIZ3_019445 [Penstemon smallii]|uniref:Uncharacterized protein n=1 Tax=Penstemon smallii TaxID=265156 RepID=A0ABD3T2M5_9LAMI